MITGLYIGNDPTDLLDLYEDENIGINSSVTDIEDIEKNTTDFIKTFTVPASNKNNRKFKHYYNADIDNSFDARVKVEGGVLLEGFVYKLGKYRLSSVQMKNNKPSSYTIQFWGSLISLKDAVGKDELSDLDLSEFDHEYTSDNVKAGLTGSLFNTNIVYNLLVKKQYYYNSDVTDTTITDELSNISYGNGSGYNGVIWNELKPSIRLIEIIKSIEAKYGFSLSRDFLGRPEFLNLFMWANLDASNTTGKNNVLVDFNSGTFTWINSGTNIGSYEVTRSTDIHFRNNIRVFPKLGFENVPYKIKAFKNGIEYASVSEIGEGFLGLPNLTIENIEADTFTHEIFLEIETSSFFEYDLQFRQQEFTGNLNTQTAFTNANNISINPIIRINNELPKMKVIDFLKGIFKMFKLVIIPTDFNSMYVNALVDYYAEGSLYDITKYIDFKKHDVNRGKLLNEINFKFQDPTTIRNSQFEEDNGKGYGNEENEIKDSEGEPLDGDSIDYTLPFEQIVYERLTDINTTDIKDVQYGAIINKELKPANPKPHIFYSINNTMTDTDIGFINEVGVKESINDTLNIPSHTMTIDSVNFSTVFSEEFSEWTSVKIDNTLYKNYHKDFIDSIFNIKRRDYKFKAKLPFRILSKLDLNDIFKIRDNYYRISNYNLNLLTGEAELNLISSFDQVIGGFTPSATDIFVDYKAQIQSIYITNLGNATFDKVDNGFDIDWVSVSSNLNNVYFSIAYNDTGLTRDMFVDITNEEATKTIRVYINQTRIVVGKLDFSNPDNIVLHQTILT